MLVFVSPDDLASPPVNTVNIAEHTGPDNFRPAVAVYVSYGGLVDIARQRLPTSLRVAGQGYIVLPLSLRVRSQKE